MSIQNIEGILSLIGKSLGDFPRLLEFGCGCGRLLLHLQSVGEKAELHGVDIDAEAISWATQNIRWAQCSVNAGLPPLDFPDEHFDLVFNHSVFTHLDEPYQDAWLAELERITKPDGLLVLTVSGERPFADMEKGWLDAGRDTTPLRDALRSRGFLYVKDDGWSEAGFPDFYHTAYHAPWYVFDRWGSMFDIQAYIVRGALKYQDLLLLKRRPARVGKVAPLSTFDLYQAQVLQLEGEIQHWRAEAEASRDALEQARLTHSKQCHELESEVQRWQTAAQTSAKTLEQVLGSRSWRVTAPLRNIAARLRPRPTE